MKNTTNAIAKVKPITHYNFGRSGNVPYAIAPDETPTKEEQRIHATGRLVFFADALGTKILYINQL